MSAFFSLYTSAPGTLVLPPESTAMVLYGWKDSEASHHLQGEMGPFFSPVDIATSGLSCHCFWLQG